MMSSGTESPFSLSPFSAAETTRVGSKLWHRRTMLAAIRSPCSAIASCNTHSSFPIDHKMIEGGELGYALAHAYGAAFDNRDLLVACVVGDGEAETGPMAASWHANKFLNPVHDGAVLPILHLNGY